MEIDEENKLVKLDKLEIKSKGNQLTFFRTEIELRDSFLFRPQNSQKLTPIEKQKLKNLNKLLDLNI